MAGAVFDKLGFDYTGENTEPGVDMVQRPPVTLKPISKMQKDKGALNEDESGTPETSAVEPR